MKKYKKYIILLLVVIFVVSIDLITKSLLEGKSIDFIKGFIVFNSVHNYGAAFSIFSNQTLFLTITSIILAVMFLLYYIFSKEENLLFLFGLSLVIGGALGNIYDRVVFGYVRDFIELDFMTFAIFNIADCALTIGGGLVLLYLIISIIQETKDKNNKI